IRMQRDDFFEKRALGASDILDRLSRHWLRHEADEIAGMACFHGDANLAVGLEAADARTMTGARVDHNEGAPRGIDLNSRRRLDAHQAIIHRPRQIPPIGDQLHLIVEYMRNSL